MIGGDMRMKILEKIQYKQSHPTEGRPVTVVFLGDSVTQGCFDCYEVKRGTLETEFHPEWGYVEKFKTMLQKLYPSVPFAVINSGVSGSSARGGVYRLEESVLAYSPDLVVVCFGLNDTNNGKGGIRDFQGYLTEIFRKVKASGAECIYMTPNTMNYEISPRIANDTARKLAADLKKRMTSGLMDEYVAAAKETASAEGVPVTDCYAIWQRLAESGVNVTDLLANKLNHPDKDMHFIFAYELIKTILA